MLAAGPRRAIQVLSLCLFCPGRRGQAPRMRSSMANGTPLPLPLELGSTPAPQPQEGIEQTIGAAVARAGQVLSVSFLEKLHTGRLSPGQRAAGGEVITNLFLLRQEYADLDFEAVAREQGRRMLEQNIYDGSLQRTPG